MGAGGAKEPDLRDLKISPVNRLRWIRMGIFAVVLIGFAALAYIPQIHAQPDSLEVNDLTGEVGPEGDFLHARKMYDRGMYDFAASQFERFLNAYPNHIHAGEAALLLAHALREQGLIQPARNAYERASVYLADSSLAVEALNSAAKMDLMLGDTSCAIDRYLAVQVLYPNPEMLARTLIRAGRLQLAIGQWQAAERTLSAILREYPGTEWESEARLLLAQSFAGQHDLIPAIEEARGVAMNTRNDSLKIAAGLLLGQWELKRLDPYAAASIWTQVLAGMPNVPHASTVAHALAQLQHRSGDLTEARAMFDRAARMAPDTTLLRSIQRDYADLFFDITNYNTARKLYIAADSTGTIRQQAWCAERIGEAELADSLLAFVRTELSGLAQLTKTLETVSSIQATDPDQALSLLESYEDDQEQLNPLRDDMLWTRAELLAITGETEKAVQAYADYAIDYPANQIAADARERSSYLRDYVIHEEVSDDELINLLRSFGDAPGDPMAQTKLAEFYLYSMKRPIPAIVVLAPLLSRNDLPDRLLPRIQRDYANAVWMEWQHATHEQSGAEIALTDSLRREAGSAIQRLTAACGNDAVLHADPERSYRVNRLREATSTIPSTVARMRRAMWEGYLDAHPESKNVNDVLLRLAEAYSMKLDGDELVENDSLGIVYLNLIAETESETELRHKAVVQLHEIYLSVDSTAIADSLAIVLLDGPDSREKHEIARYWLNTKPESPQAEEARKWLLNETWYRPDFPTYAPILADWLIGMGDSSSDQDVRDNIAQMYRWQMQLRPDDPAFHEPKFAAGNSLLLRAMASEVEGRRLDAILEYTRYMKFASNPEISAMVALRLARLYDNAGHWEHAVPYYTQALARNTEDPLLQPLRRSLARWAYTSGEYEQAYDWAKLAAMQEQNPDTAFALEELAIVSLYSDGRLEEAGIEAPAFRGWYKDHPKLDEALAHFELERGRYHSSLGQYISSLSAYKAVTGKFKNTRYAANGKYELARDYMERGEAEKAYEMLIELSNDYPEHEVMGQVYWLLGNYYVSTGKYFEAFDKYETVLADSAYSESWPHVLGNQVRAFKEAGFYEGAMRAARQYLELYPDAADAFDHRMNLALSYHETGHYDLAISQFRRAMVLADGEDYPACQFYIAEAMERAGRLKEAVSEYMRVVHLNRPSKLQWGITALYSAGKVLERLNEPERAKSLYREIVAREGMGSPFGRRADEQVKRLEMFEMEKAAAESE